MDIPVTQMRRKIGRTRREVIMAESMDIDNGDKGERERFILLQLKLKYEEG